MSEDLVERDVERVRNAVRDKLVKVGVHLGHESLTMIARAALAAMPGWQPLSEMSTEAAEKVLGGYKLPCAVRLPPATTISSGCSLFTVFLGLEARRAWIVRGSDTPTFRDAPSAKDHSATGGHHG